MRIPDTFHDALRQEFGERLRARWSYETQSVHIEQKVGVGAWGLKPRPGQSCESDAYIRARDGYAQLLTVEPGDRKPCPACRRVTPIPALQFREAKCQHCGKRFRAVYFPLGEWLLEHLRRTDPYRGGLERQLAELEDAEAARERSRRRQLANHTEEVWKDSFTQVFQIPSVGYTGKEVAWLTSPKSSAPITTS